MKYQTLQRSRVSYEKTNLLRTLGVLSKHKRQIKLHESTLSEKKALAKFVITSDLSAERVSSRAAITRAAVLLKPERFDSTVLSRPPRVCLTHKS